MLAPTSDGRLGGLKRRKVQNGRGQEKVQKLKCDGVFENTLQSWGPASHGFIGGLHHVMGSSCQFCDLLPYCVALAILQLHRVAQLAPACLLVVGFRVAEGGRRAACLRAPTPPPPSCRDRSRRLLIGLRRLLRVLALSGRRGTRPKAKIACLMICLMHLELSPTGFARP